MVTLVLPARATKKEVKKDDRNKKKLKMKCEHFLYLYAIFLVGVLAIGGAFWHTSISLHRIARSYNTIQQIQEDVKHLQDITSVLEPAREEKQDGF